MYYALRDDSTGQLLMFFGDEDTAPVPMEGQSIVEFDYDPKERAKEIAGGEPGPVYYDESTGELRVEPPGPPPPPADVQGAVTTPPAKAGGFLPDTPAETVAPVSRCSLRRSRPGQERGRSSDSHTPYKREA